MLGAYFEMIRTMRPHRTAKGSAVLDLILALLPGRLHRWVRLLRGHEIHRTAKIGFGSVLRVDSLKLGPGAQVGPLCFLRARRAVVGEGSSLAPLTLVSASDVSIGRKTRIASFSVIWGPSNRDRCKFTIGDHSQIFPFCWLEPGHGIHMGSRVGIGGHGLIFTHGSWANFFRGAPVTFGPVVIEDRVWLPWRVFVMPNVVIGAGAIIGAGSVVTRSVPAEALAAGVPATVLRAHAWTDLDQSMIRTRMVAAVDAFKIDFPEFESAEFALNTDGVLSDLEPTSSVLTMGAEPSECRLLQRSGHSIIDVGEEKAWLVEDDLAAKELAAWLSAYGVRIDVQ